MEKQTSCSRIVYTPTSAARIANVKNNRETLLLARASRGLSCQSEGSLRAFYKEKAKANSFLHKVHSKSPGMLIAKRDENEGKGITDEHRVDEKITRSEAREAMKAQRIRRARLDVSQTEETQRRIQEFLSRDIPGTRSLRVKLGHSKEKSVVSEFEERSLNDSNQDANKTNVATPKPIKIRCRTSGICFSCAYCHPLQSSSSAPNMIRKYSEELRLHLPRNSSKAQFRKLSLPMVGQMSLDRSRLYDVSTPYLHFTGNNITSRGVYIPRRNLNSAPKKKHSI